MAVCWFYDCESFLGFSKSHLAGLGVLRMHWRCMAFDGGNPNRKNYDIQEGENMKALAKKFAQIFFGVESAEEMKKKGLLLSLAIPAVRWFDWAMVGMTAALVVFLKSQEFAGWKIFVLLWGGNIILSAATISLNDKVKIDLTLAEGLRRLINAAIEKSRLSGLVLEGLLMFRLLLWDGPCAFVIFLRERIKPETEIMVLIIASGIQMAVWTVIYSLGYEGILGAIKALF